MDEDKFWNDESNWSGAIYFCKQDPRLWVPKRQRWMGCTINLGHRRGPLALMLTILVPFLLLVGIFGLECR